MIASLISFEAEFLENFLPYSRPFLEDYMTSLYNGILEGELKEARKINPIFVAQYWAAFDNTKHDYKRPCRHYCL